MIGSFIRKLLFRKLLYQCEDEQIHDPVEYVNETSSLAKSVANGLEDAIGRLDPEQKDGKKNGLAL